MNLLMPTPIIHQRYIQWLAVLCIGFLMVLAAEPVQVGFCKTDIALIWCVMTMMIVLVMLESSVLIAYHNNAHKVSRVGWNLVDSLITAGALYYLLRTWIGGDYSCASSFLQTMAMVLLYCALRGILSHAQLPSAWLMVGLIACGAYEAGLGYSQILSGASRHSLYLISGTFRNSGPYSAFLMLGAAIGLAWMQELAQGWKKYVVMAITVVMIVLLPATWSRAALLSLSIVALLMFRRDYWAWRWAVWSVCLTVGIALYFLKQGSADGRLLTWAASLQTWQHSPWMGVGIGGFHEAVADGIAEYYVHTPTSPLFSSGGVAEYAFNDLLKVLVEQGIIGAVLMIAIIGCVLLRLWSHSQPLFYGMMSLLIFSLFSYPFELLPYRIIAVVMIAWAASVRSRESEDGASSHKVVLPLLLLIPSFLISEEIARLLEADNDYQLIAGMEHEAFIKDYYDLWPRKNDDARFLFDFGKILRAHGKYNDSNEMFRQGSRISADPMFQVLIGNNYRDLGCPDLAETSYKRAFSIMPNRIYPLYQLMQLYKDADDTCRAREYAAKIIAFHEKVSSPATRQIKEEATAYLAGNLTQAKNENIK